MRGFYSAKRKTMPKQDKVVPFMATLDTEEELQKESDAMGLAGYTVDEKNNVYLLDGYGAFCMNIDESIKTIKDLKNYTFGRDKKKLYEEYIKQMEDFGIEYVIGPAAPVKGNNITGSNGLYCKNYEKVAEMYQTVPRFLK